METIGERIRRNRVIMKWNQQDLAGRLDVTRANVSQWESGKWPPRHIHIETMAKLFGVSAAHLKDGGPVSPPIDIAQRWAALDAAIQRMDTVVGRLEAVADYAEGLRQTVKDDEPGGDDGRMSRIVARWEAGLEERRVDVGGG